MEGIHAKQTVLVVDDTPENIDVLDGILESEYRIKAATSGKIALKIAKSHKPDLILLDIMMPEMDGYEVYRQLKTDESTRTIPVIFVTAKDDVDAEKVDEKFGPVESIMKPVEPNDVLSIVRKYLEG